MKNPCAAVLPLVTLACLLLSAAGQAATKDYSRQDLPNKDFKDAMLDNSNFDEANLEYANFTNASLKGCSFRNAKLRGTIFYRAVLDGADFTGADLTSVRFTDAKAWYARVPDSTVFLARASLLDLKALGRKVNLDYKSEQLLVENQEATCGSLSFHYADLHGTRFLGNAEGIDFRGADLRGADFSAAENLDKAKLKGAKYDESTVWKIDPVAAQAVLMPGAKTAPGGTAPPPRSKHPLQGKWLILKEKGAKDRGTLRVYSDFTYEWDFSADSPVAKGKWEEAGEQILLKKGELDADWKAKGQAKDELLLSTDKGEERIAVRAPDEEPK